MTESDALATSGKDGPYMKGKDGIKSSYELAMERLSRRDGSPTPLTDEQKKALGEVDSQTRARVAEIEITMDRQIAEARASGDEAKARELQELRAADIRRQRDRGEDEKERIRSGAR